MWYIRALCFSLLFSNTICCLLAPDSLRSIATEAVLNNSQLMEDNEQYPDLVQKDIGYAFLKKNLSPAWELAGGDAPLQDLMKVRRDNDKTRGIFFLGSSTQAVSVTGKGILTWWETFPYPQCICSEATGYTGVTGFSVSPNGQLTALAAGNKVSLWKNKTHEKIWELDRSLDMFRKMASSPDEAIEQDENGPYKEEAFSVFCTNDQLIVGGSRGKIVVWNIESLLKKNVRPNTIIVHARLADTVWARALNRVHSIYCTVDGQRCISLVNKHIKVWNTSNGTLCKEYRLDHTALFADAFFRECDWDQEKKKFNDLEVISCFHDGTIILLRLIDGRTTKLKLATQDYLASCVVSQNGRFLLTGTRNERVDLWERKELPTGITFEKVATFTGRSINSQLAFRADSSGILIGNNYGEISLWAISNQIPYSQAQELLRGN